jgi:hypothetical protein
MLLKYTMNLVKLIDQYNSNNLIFCEPIKNNIMNDGTFVRILYSSDIITFNGVYLLINLSECSCEKFYNKIKCTFNSSTQKELIEKLKVIEEDILKKYNNNKIPLFKIYEQISSGFIKIYSEIGTKYNNLFILKISGIWETQTHYGLTYKFMKTF